MEDGDGADENCVNLLQEKEGGHKSRHRKKELTEDQKVSMLRTG